MDGSGHIPVWQGPSVERTNARGRRFFCEEFKAWIVEQAAQPGMSVAGLAMRNGVNANQLRRWVQLHQRRSAVAVKLLPVTITPEVAPEPARRAPPIEIELPGALVRVPEGADARLLRTVLDALRGRGS